MELPPKYASTVLHLGKKKNKKNKKKQKPKNTKQAKTKQNRFWNCSDSVVFFVFYLIILPVVLFS